MHFRFVLDLLDTDLLNIDLLDTHLDLLDTDIPNKEFVCLQDVLKTFSRHVLKTSLRHVFNSLEDVFSVTIFCLPRSLQDVLQNVFKTSSQDFFKMSSRRLKDVLEDKKLLR